jgi:hypothetical protein
MIAILEVLPSGDGQSDFIDHAARPHTELESITCSFRGRSQSLTDLDELLSL